MSLIYFHYLLLSVKLLVLLGILSITCTLSITLRTARGWTIESRYVRLTILVQQLTYFVFHQSCDRWSLNICALLSGRWIILFDKVL